MRAAISPPDSIIIIDADLIENLFIGCVSIPLIKVHRHWLGLGNSHLFSFLFFYLKNKTNCQSGALSIADSWAPPTPPPPTDESIWINKKEQNPWERTRERENELYGFVIKLCVVAVVVAQDHARRRFQIGWVTRLVPLSLSSPPLCCLLAFVWFAIRVL